jgi:hypothetical protein
MYNARIRPLRTATAAVALVFAGLAITGGPAPSAQTSSCPGPNPIVCENSKTGNPASEWDVANGGDASIVGFATDISVNHGDAVHFKINTPSIAYNIEIYRMGYYGGLGARRLATISPSVTLPQPQPDCLSDSTTGLIDCANWQESASWTVPADAPSGIYFAKLNRLDASGRNHIYFIVRSDESQSDLLFQTSDTTWEAYNTYGGNSLYVGLPAGRAYKVSYNRPFINRAANNVRSSPFYAEYPMVRWLEANGYDVSYFAGVDTDRFGQTLLRHKVFLSVGHDEYWSAGQRAAVETARGAGVHLAFFSGNEIFWKTRWEPSIDVNATAYRTLVSYKETHANQKIDPTPAWTGTWRDPRFSPPADGGRPENALTGTIFTVNCCTDAIKVPAEYGHLRFWRNTSVAALPTGTVATMPQGTLGYEWDEDLDNGFRPAGLTRLSATTLSVQERLLDQGTNYGPGTATHNLTLYRHGSGALVFSAGTIQWSWGLDAAHDTPSSAADPRMQQATVNLLADMGIQPATLRSGLVPASASNDHTPPSSAITSPTAGAVVVSSQTIQIAGTASDPLGVVAGVEVSVDNGVTWHAATGRETWTYAWQAGASGTVTIRARAIDDSGNVESPGPAVSVLVLNAPCPCSIWNPSTAVPAIADAGDSAGVELGVKFRSSVDGFISGLRFYKSTANTGTHVAHLWTTDGTLLASATFTTETGSGWQEVSFAPVAVAANAVYIASYYAPGGHYSVTRDAFTSAGVDTPPLHALANGTSVNGVYRYGASGFPSQSYNATNYWVDAVFVDTLPPDTTPPTVTGISPAAGAVGVAVATSVRATFSEAIDPATVTATTFELLDPGLTPVPATVSYDAAARTATLTPTAPLAAASTYTARVRGGGAGARVTDMRGNALAADVTWSFTTSSQGCPCSIWDPTSAAPATADTGDGSALELGVKFRSDFGGFITGLRFYKSAANTGQHVANLWAGNGTLLGSATFTSETPSGWQEVTFPTPVAIAAQTDYVASYYTPSGHYSVTRNYFTSAGADAPPLHALPSATSLNGVYRYGSSGFPATSYLDTNYWVDVVFNMTSGSDTTPPTVTAVSPAAGASGVAVGTSVSVSFSEPMAAATITDQAIELRDAGNALVPATVSYDGPTRTAILAPTAPLAGGIVYTARVHGGAIDPRVKDLAGNALAADVTWSFTTQAAASCPCSIWNPATAVPAIVDTGDVGAVELGLRFRSDLDGVITGLRFFKSSANTGTHVGNLWANDGTLLASAVFTSESASGWQTVQFAAPVPIVANATYVASYHTATGHYSVTRNAFTSAGVDAAPLHALASGSAGNGLYGYGAASAFPTSTYQGTNYWVDPIFTTTSPAPDTTPPTVVGRSPAPGATGVGLWTSVRATFNEPVQPATVTTATFELLGAGGAPVTASVSYDAPTRTATLVPAAALIATSVYTARVRGGGVKDLAGNALAADDTWTFTTGTVGCPCSIWNPASAAPAIADSGDGSALELGVKFRSDLGGFITGLRFYKSAANTGPHVANLWASNGTLLGSATFTSETPSGWQEVTFPTPVAITAQTDYVASYYTPSGHYSVTRNYFTSAGADAPPLHALPSTTSINGVYRYGASGFPAASYLDTNYWVDVVFNVTSP